MKIFISWSGEPSQTFARALAGWLQMVIQAVKPFMSTNDIRSGQRWSNEIGKQLEETTFGIICLTPENKEAPWIHFEAGALSKFVDKSAVVPLCIGIEKVNIPGPLQQFQAKGLSKEDVFALVTDINSLIEPKLPDLVLSKIFNGFWPELDAAAKAAQEAVKHLAIPPAKRSNDAIIEETLNTVRALAGNVEDMKSQLMTQFMPRGLGALSGIGDAGIDTFHARTPIAPGLRVGLNEMKLGDLLKMKIADSTSFTLADMAKAGLINSPAAGSASFTLAELAKGGLINSPAAVSVSTTSAEPEKKK